MYVCEDLLVRRVALTVHVVCNVYFWYVCSLSLVNTCYQNNQVNCMAKKDDGIFKLQPHSFCLIVATMYKIAL